MSVKDLKIKSSNRKSGPFIDPFFSIFVTMMIITFCLHVGLNYSVFPIRMDVRADLAGQDQNAIVHVLTGDMALVVL